MFHHEEIKFKIGDLVKIAKEVNLISDQVLAKVGDIGLIVEIFPGKDNQVSLWGVDYTVLVKGKRLLFFADELELVKNQNKLAGTVKFVYIKK